MRIRDEKNSDPGYGKKSKPGSGIVRTARIRKKDILATNIKLISLSTQEAIQTNNNHKPQHLLPHLRDSK
jgi:hypothetical protein